VSDSTVPSDPASTPVWLTVPSIRGVTAACIEEYHHPASGRIAAFRPAVLRAGVPDPVGRDGTGSPLGDRRASSRRRTASAAFVDSSETGADSIGRTVAIDAGAACFDGARVGASVPRETSLGDPIDSRTGAEVGGANVEPAFWLGFAIAGAGLEKVSRDACRVSRVSTDDGRSETRGFGDPPFTAGTVGCVRAGFTSTAAE